MDTHATSGITGNATGPPTEPRTEVRLQVRIVPSAAIVVVRNEFWAEVGDLRAEKNVNSPTFFCTFDAWIPGG